MPLAMTRFVITLAGCFFSFHGRGIPIAGAPPTVRRPAVLPTANLDTGLTWQARTMNRPSMLACVLYGCCVMAFRTAPPAAAEMVTLIPVADTSLNERNPNNNMGGLSFVASGRDGSGSGLRRRGLFRFDLGSIPTNASIESASLRLTVGSGNVANGRSFSLYRLLVNWGEGTKSANLGLPATAGEATWNNRFHPDQPWSSPGGAAGIDYVTDKSSSTFVGGLGNYTWADLESDIQFWLRNPEQNFGWMLISDDEGAVMSARRFSSRTAGPNARPMLTVVYTLPVLAGDANNDGKVDLLDFNILKTFFGTGTTREQGDFNGDGVVNLADFNILKNNFGTVAATAVPEPSSLWLAIAGLLCAGAGRKIFPAWARRSK